MKKRIVLAFIATYLIAIQLNAQSFKEHRGDIFFSRFSYQKAALLYQNAIEKDTANPVLMRKLAESYKFLGKDSLSSQWYDKLIKTGKADTTDYNNYYIVLKNDEEYDKANEVLKKAQSNNGTGSYLLSRQFAENLKSKAYRYEISLVSQSSTFADFSPAYFGNKILFVSSRQGSGVTKRTYARDGQPFLQLFIADTTKNGQLTNIKEFNNKINTRYHEGPLCYSVSDSTLYFTRNNFNHYKKLSSDGKLNLKIFSARFTYNEWLKSVENLADSIGLKAKIAAKDWREIKDFKFNSDEYSTGHPTIAKDGKKMYFSSDMPGGKGGTDIYMCERESGGEWSKPINLKEINTKGDEMFPFIHSSGVLFFASDGLPGLGGMDIFKAIPKGNGFEQPENMGAPLNSTYDDFGLIADDLTKTGYFSSNRKKGVGSDDLYFVKFSNVQYVTLAIRVIEKENGQSINDATIKLADQKTAEDKQLNNSRVGLYMVKVSNVDILNLDVQKSEFEPYTELVKLEGQKQSNDTIYLTAPLQRKVFYGVYGSVFIKETKEIVPEVTLTFEPVDGGQSVEIISNDKGDFRTLLKEKTNYNLAVTKKDFFTIKDKYTTTDKNPGWINLNEFVNLSIEKIDVNKTIEIPNIYYDLGKWNIRKDAAVELEKVVTLLNDNPSIKIELGSHTDARGDAASNQTLSQKRAQSAVDYIIGKGISKDRIVAKGYGESKLKNRCADGVKCTEKEHQENRRTEIRVLSF